MDFNKESLQKVRRVDKTFVNNLDLVSKCLDVFDLSENDSSEALEEGYLNSNLSKFVEEKKTKCFLNLDKTPYETNFNFVDAIEEKELTDELFKFIFYTDYFTFLQKTTLMAEFGFIGNRVLKTAELARAFRCSNNNFQLRKTASLSKLKKAFKDKKTSGNFVYKTDLFSYFQTQKKILLNLIETNLTEAQTRILKMVWGDDFSSFNRFAGDLLTDDEIILYYNTIGKLYNVVIDTDVFDMTQRLNLNHGYALRR